MKTIKLLIAGAILLGAQLSFAQGKTPEDAVKTYNSSMLGLIKKGDSKELKAVTSKDMYELNKVTIDMVKSMGTELPTELPKLEKLNCKETGDKATCDCKQAGEEREQQLMLIKTANGWIINGMSGKVITEKDIEQTKAMFKAMQGIKEAAEVEN